MIEESSFSAAPSTGEQSQTSFFLFKANYKVAASYFTLVLTLFNRTSCKKKKNPGINP